MSRNLYLISILYVLIHFVANAQTKNTLNGYVRDKSNGEALIGATVFIKELKTGTATNVYGFYSITVPAGNYTLDFSYVGYATIQQPLDLTNSIRLDIELSPTAQELQEVVVTGSRIATPNLDAISPVTAITSEEIKSTGVTKIEDLLNSLPQVVADQGSGLSMGSTW